MEEFVGKIWHGLVTRASSTSYPDAEITLDEIRPIAAILFRSLGGDGGLMIENATETTHGARRKLMQRISGAGQKVELAWRDEETLRLPSRINCFPQKSLNRDLYLWLAALAALPEIGNQGWLSTNQQQTARTLKKWPGINSRYQRLVTAHIAQRPDPEQLPEQEAALENTIRHSLLDPHHFMEPCPAGLKPPQPVILWLHPQPPGSEQTDTIALSDPEDAEAPAENNSKKRNDQNRKKAERTEMPEGKDGLLAFRLESLFSWAEFIKVDRTTDEDQQDEEDAMKTAEDMDIISVARDDKSIASRLRLDLDLPSDEYDDIRLGDGIPLPEWDFKKQRMQQDYCRLQPMLARDASPTELPEELRSQARTLRQQFEMLRPQRRWFSRQTDGTEIDLENYQVFLTNQKLGRVNTDHPVYRDYRNDGRSLSCLLLADLSLSTDAWVNNNAQVISIIRDSLFLFSEALSATGDRFALHGFSSRNRSHVRFHQIKSFSEKYSADIRGRINKIKPGYYTRMGAAIRHASNLLEKEPSEQKILLILTDGKPNDLDKYESRYGIEDTRMAILEAQKKGLQPFCVTIDEKAQDYLPYLFGSNSYVLIKNAEELPAKLPLLYMRMTC